MAKVTYFWVISAPSLPAVWHPTPGLGINIYMGHVRIRMKVYTYMYIYTYVYYRAAVLQSRHSHDCQGQILTLAGAICGEKSTTSKVCLVSFSLEINFDRLAQR